MPQLSLKQQKMYYRALVEKNATFDGVFFAAIKTTGVFCHPHCPARKPKFENCEFYLSAQEALLAGFRPCKRCRPLSLPGASSHTIEKLIAAIEQNPEKRWRDCDLKTLSIDASTARRQFKKRFGMTFVAYARARRLGLAMKHIKKGNSIIDAQLQAGFNSASGFSDAFSQFMGNSPSKINVKQQLLQASWIDTPLGPMLVIADETQLFLLEFVKRRGLEKEIIKLRKKLPVAIVPGDTDPIISIKKELKAYFNGRLQQFQTPIKLLGTPFQQTVWHALMNIPFGSTISYATLAKNINKPTAFRAVANANGANQLAIIIPCHRVIQNDGGLGGYGGGLAHKQWLLDHEKNISI